MIKRIFFLFCTLTAAVSFAGKLEDFADEFEYVVKHARTVEQLDSKARFRDDFRLKLFRLQASAADIQMVATKIGIREITIGNDVKAMIETINIDRKTHLKREKWESRSFAVRDIRRQITYLKNLRFSVERRTFVPNRYYLEELNVIIRFSRRWEQCQKIAYSKNVLSPYAISEYQKRYFGEIQRLARLLDQKIKKDRIRISENYQLSHNVNRFVTAWKINTQHFEETRKRNRDNTHSGDYRSSPEVEARLNEMKLLAAEIEKDLNYLVESGVVLYLKDDRFSPQQLAEMMKKLKMPVPGAKPVPEPDAEQPALRLDAKKLARMYNEKKQQIYLSESKMNGVSQDFYNRYRKLLPPRQQKEMDEEMVRYTKNSYPPALARSTAVKKIHLKYSGNKHGCTPEEIMNLLNLTPGDL